jgi:hypothetical protein
MDPKGTKTFWDSGPSREILQWLTDLVVRHRVAPSPQEATDKKLNLNLGHYVISVHTVPTPAVCKAVEGKLTWEHEPGMRRRARPGGALSAPDTALGTGAGGYAAGAGPEALPDLTSGR